MIFVPGGKIPADMNRKGWILLFSTLALIAVLLLASGLRSVQFQPSRPLPNVLPTTVQAPLNMPEQIVQTPLWKVLLLGGAFLLNMFLFFLLLSPEARKRVLKQVIRFTLTAVAIYIALRNYYLKVVEQDANQNPQGNAGANLPSVNEAGPTFHPPQMTPWATFLVSLGVLLVLFVLLWVGYHWWQRKYGRRSTKTLADIAAVARSSLKAIASGSDWGDVIIQSYIRRGEAVSRTR